MLKSDRHCYITTGLFFFLNIFIIFFIVEVLSRIINHQKVFQWMDYRGTTYNLYKSTLPVQYHDVLGWIPKPGFSGTHAMWNKKITIMEDGIRSNGNPAQLNSLSPILAAGDSFTFGDQVADHETWPSFLEKQIHRPVLNAGVFAYGLDQSFLRLKLLIHKYKPGIIILSFIPDDIYRCEYSTTFGANKPYFTIKNKTLTLQGVPVPDNIHKSNFIFQIPGYSYFIHAMMMKWNPNGWLSGGYALNENPTGYSGKDIACLIFKDLEKIIKTNHIREAYIVVQDTNPSTSSADIDAVLSCINNKVFHIIDTREILNDVKNMNPTRYNSFFNIHMTAWGNQFIAETILNKMHMK